MMKKEAEFYEKLEDGKVQCHVCGHSCVIKDGGRGFCNTRLNEKGTLYTLTYGSLISNGSIDPIEKKPLYHFYPGKTAYSIASIGCSAKCDHCQNWSISRSIVDVDGRNGDVPKKDRGPSSFRGSHISLVQKSPEALIQLVKRAGAETIAFTYNEPLIWYEYVRDVSLLAQKEDIKTILVTNGYSSLETNKEYVKFIDAANIDVKAFDDEFYKNICKITNWERILDTAKCFHENGVHVEITNLIIPGYNDSEEMIKALINWVRDELDDRVPIHFSAYHPVYKLQAKSTPTKTLLNAYTWAKKAGLHYVFLGNVRTPEGNNSYCPECEALLVSRMGYHIEIKHLKSGKCTNCNAETGITQSKPSSN